MNAEIDSAQLAIDAYTSRLREGATNIFNLVTKTSPGCDHDELFAACALAAGMFFANAEYPNIPANIGPRAGSLFAAGILLGRADRTEREIKTCMGAA